MHRCGNRGEESIRSRESLAARISRGSSAYLSTSEEKAVFRDKIGPGR